MQQGCVDLEVDLVLAGVVVPAEASEPMGSFAGLVGFVHLDSLVDPTSAEEEMDPFG